MMNSIQRTKGVRIVTTVMVAVAGGILLTAYCSLLTVSASDPNAGSDWPMSTPHPRFIQVETESSASREQ